MVKGFSAVRSKLTDPPRQALSVAVLALLIAFAALVMVLGARNGR